jgi:hypothetical protein
MILSTICNPGWGCMSIEMPPHWGEIYADSPQLRRSGVFVVDEWGMTILRGGALISLSFPFVDY